MFADAHISSLGYLWESRGKNGGSRECKAWRAEGLDPPVPAQKVFLCRTTNENMKILARSIELFPNDYVYKNANKSTSVRIHANLAVDLFHNDGLYILISLSDLLRLLRMCIIQKFPTFKRDQKGSGIWSFHKRFLKRMKLIWGEIAFQKRFVLYG